MCPVDVKMEEAMWQRMWATMRYEQPQLTVHKEIEILVLQLQGTELCYQQ